MALKKRYIKKYLNRINYFGDLQPNVDTLRKLQRAHLLNIPFENLDIHCKTPILLDPDRIYNKIIENKRGGFCYELNGLFYELLHSLGFKVRLISARVHQNDNQYSPEYDHMAIIATINEMEYLTDVGFGEFILEPLKIEVGVYQDDPRGRYIIDYYDDNYLKINKLENEDVIPVFIFRNIRREFREFNQMCHYHQNNPDSHFMKNRLISLATEQGRMTISGNKLKIRNGDISTEKLLETEIEFEKELLERFRVKLN